MAVCSLKSYNTKFLFFVIKYIIFQRLLGTCYLKEVKVTIFMQHIV